MVIEFYLEKRGFFLRKVGHCRYSHNVFFAISASILFGTTAKMVSELKKPTGKGDPIVLDNA